MNNAVERVVATGWGGMSMIGFKRWMVVAVLLMLAVLGSASAQNAVSTPLTAEELRTNAEGAVREGRLVEAWKALVMMDGADPNAWQQCRDMVSQVATELNKQARVFADGNEADKAVEIASMLGHERSLALVGKVFPADVATLVEAMRVTQGTAWWKKGQAEGLRGDRDKADTNYRTALEFLKAGDRRYPQALHDFAASLRDRGLEFLNARREQDATLYLQSAVATFQKLVDAPAADPQLVAIGKENIQRLGQVPGIVANGAGIATPTPTPTPTPAPTWLEQILGPATGTTGFLNQLKGNQQLQVRIVTVVVGLLIFVVVYWLLPWLVLRTLARNVNPRASEALTRVRLLGPFALALYAVWTMKDRKESAASPVERHACPHCSYQLDDPFTYEDLVFSRCPKCKGQIEPLYTVEGIITMLSNSLATDVERVNQGQSSLDKFVERDAMTRLVRAVLTLAVRRRASDLHIEPDEKHLVIRQRIDGIITEMVALPRSLALAFVSAVKVSANLNIAERRKPQDGKMSFTIDRAEIDIRVASSPSGGGEKVSLRLLDCRSIQLEAKHLGMNPRGLEIFNRSINAPHGLVIVAGPTGSGKTTTLYVALQTLKSGSKNIISIEDPIEFRIPGVNQIQVNPTAGLTFASGLRSMLRQDPDVIMVGEIRDHETAEIAVNAATTGHLVFTTLHTIDASSTISRLIDLGVGARQFADALNLIIAQRLIRLICQSCIEDYVPSPEEIKKMDLANWAPESLKRGKGCPVCNGTGYFRRMGLFEYLEPSERLRGSIESGSLSTTEIREIAVAAGMRTMRAEAISLLQRGVITIDEALRVTK
ncbi:hypothetical protein GC173_12825 [bacterium]|nr:hypothetical protein [bacterium]